MDELGDTQTESPSPTEDFGCVRVDLGVGEFIEVTPDGDFYCLANADEEIQGEVSVKRVQITRQPVSAYAQTVPTNPDGEHGLVVKFRTVTGRLEQRVVSSASFHESNAALPAWLGVRGVKYDSKYVGLLRRYFALAQPPIQVQAYERTGWNTAPSGEVVFVLGESGVMGGSGNSVFQPGAATSVANIGQRGTLEDWQENVARPACAVPWWRFAIMAALAAPLLKVIDEAGRGFHVVGKTSQGKTIGTCCAASVFGRGSKNDPDSFVVTWNGTKNGIEGTAEAHADLVLPLDELAEADARTVGNLIYLITGGVGRSRMKGDISMQRRKSWRVILLSTGEVTLEAKVREGGQRYSGGMSVRIAEINADNTGFTTTIDNTKVKDIEGAVQRYYGTAGARFVERMVAERYGDPTSATVATLKSRLQEIEADLVGADTDQRRRRAARSFAIVQAAGELGVMWGILPTEIAPAETCQLAYAIWRDRAGSRDTDDTRMAAERVLSLIDEGLNASVIRLDDAVRNSESERNNRERRGWYVQQDDKLVVFLLPATLDKVLGGYSQDTFLEEAVRLGFVVLGDGRNRQVKVPGMGSYRPRAYKFDYYRLQEFCDGAAGATPNQPAEETQRTPRPDSTLMRSRGGRPLGVPPCYGNQLDGMSKCILCPFESDCDQDTPSAKSRDERLECHTATAAATAAYFVENYPSVARAIGGVGQ